MDPATGTGDIIVHHDFHGSVISYEPDTILTIPVAYLALSTNDELQTVMEKSDVCYQTIEVVTQTCMDYISWTSLNGDQWSLAEFCDG